MGDEICQHVSIAGKSGIKAAITVVAGKGEIVRIAPASVVPGACNKNLAIGQYRNTRCKVTIAAKVSGHLAIHTKRSIKTAVAVVAGNRMITNSIGDIGGSC